MRILAITAVPPEPARSGYQIRCLEILRRLAERHDVSLISGVRSTAKAASGPTFRLAGFRVTPLGRTTPWSLARSLVSDAPHHAGTHCTADLRRMVSDVVRGGIDVVYAHYLYFAPALPAAGTPGRPACVLDQHNVDHEVWDLLACAEANPVTRWFWARQAQLMRRFEARHLPAFDAVVSVSERDAEATRAVLGAGSGTRVVVAPNGVDLARIRPRSRREAQAPPTVVFTGTSARRNVEGVAWFLRACWPGIRACVPAARFVLAGAFDRAALPVDVRQAQGLEVTGPVQDVVPYLHAADVAVVPVRLGGGTKLKALEAMAVGLPVVATARSAAGLEVRDGVDLLVRDEPVGYIEAVVTLLRDAGTAARLGTAARRHVEARHGWDDVTRTVENVLERASGRALIRSGSGAVGTPLLDVRRDARAGDGFEA